MRTSHRLGPQLCLRSDSPDATCPPFLMVSGAVPDPYAPRERLADIVWDIALDQRSFGPRRLLVAFADADGTFRGIAHARRTDPPHLGLAPCIAFLGECAAACVALCDEPVVAMAPTRVEVDRFAAARDIAAARGIHLVDWIQCDGDVVRSIKLALTPDAPWWDVPPASPLPRSA